MKQLKSRKGLRQNQRSTKEQVFLKCTSFDVDGEGMCSAAQNAAHQTGSNRAERHCQGCEISSELDRTSKQIARAVAHAVAQAECIRQGHIRKEKEEVDRQHQEWYEWLQAEETRERKAFEEAMRERRHRLRERRVNHLARSFREAELEHLGAWKEQVRVQDDEVETELNIALLKERNEERSRFRKRWKELEKYRPLKDEWVLNEIEKRANNQGQHGRTEKDQASAASAKIDRARIRKRIRYHEQYPCLTMHR